MGERGHRSQFHPDLRAAWWWPQLPVNRHTLDWLRKPVTSTRSRDDVHREVLAVGQHEVRVHTPVGATGPLPVVFRVHGGGMVLGSPAQDDAANQQLAAATGAVVVSPGYRLAPEHPLPAAVEDLVQAYRWMAEQAEQRGWDSARVVVTGMSAGGGLVASLVAWLHDHAASDPLPRPLLQVLLYPMLDHRTVAAPGPTRMWTAAANRFGWSSAVGSPPELQDPPPYASAARRKDLSGLPPAWIGVGTLDLFHDEDLAHAARLEEAGVPVRTFVVPGAFHAFDTFLAHTPVARQFTEEWTVAIRDAFGS